MKNPIRHIAAVDGMIEFVLADGTILPPSKDTFGLAVSIAHFGMDAYCSSSMDFASEYGFDNDGDAKLMLNSAVEIYENNKVAA